MFCEVGLWNATLLIFAGEQWYKIRFSTTLAFRVTCSSDVLDKR